MFIVQAPGDGIHPNFLTLFKKLGVRYHDSDHNIYHYTFMVEAPPAIILSLDFCVTFFVNTLPGPW